MISFKSFGDLKNTESFLKRMEKEEYFSKLDRYAMEGVLALSKATPKRSGKTAASWGYIIERDSKSTKIIWTNDNVNKDVNIAVILEYGHGTRNGGYVQGIDYINPAIRPIFEKISTSAWEEVTKR